MPKILFQLLYSFTLRCPHCRQEWMPRTLYGFHHQCSRCKLVYQGDSGDFWGGVVIGYAFAGLTGMVIGLVMTLIGGFGWETTVYTSSLSGLASILVFFPFAKSLWIHLLYHTRGQYEEYRPPE